MAKLNEIVDYCNTLLAVDGFDDYCPNGLQVDAGRGEINRLATGVTASLAVIEQAAAWGAQLLLVHHGYFWRGEPLPLTGMKGRRVRTLMQKGLSLLVYHLPLDAHPQLGNNVQLGRALGLEGRAVDERGLLWVADLAEPVGVGHLTQAIDKALDRTPQRLSARGDVQRIAWCTGAAQGSLERAVAAGAQAYISGEISEQSFHQVAELGIHYFAAGHHATERFGVKALGAHLAEHFSLETSFFDQDNPV